MRRRLCLISVFILGLAPSAGLAQFDERWNPVVRRLLESEVPGDERGRFAVDFLHMYLQPLRVPPLVTTGPPGSSATYGDPLTEVLRGDGRIASRHGRYIGGRMTADWWLSRTSPFGVSASGTFLERDSSNITYDPHTITPLARPYIDANDGLWKSFIVAGNSTDFGELSGSVNVYSRMELFHQDANLVMRLVGNSNSQLNFLMGARFIQLRERLDITATSRVLPDEAVLLGVSDHFQTFDKFFGGQLGFSGLVRRGRWSLEGKGTLAYGADVQEIRTKGDRVIHTPESRDTTDYGLYVLPSNRGAFERVVDDFVTEWNLTLGWAFNSRFKWRFGYSLLTWNHPVRPGDQIEPINLSQVSPGGLVGPLAPTIPFRSDFFWAQGMHFGLEVRW